MSEQQLEQEPEETTRDALEAAFDEQEETPDETSETPAATEAETETSEPVAAQPESEGVETEVSEPEQVASTANAPQSWSPAAREEWANVPDSVKTVVAKREQEMQSVMQDSAQARQFSQNFEQSIGAYNQLFASQGVDALTGLNEVMQTAAPLYSGTPQQKAEAVAGLIQQFGIDISTLDDLLVGNQAPPMDANMQGMQDQITSMGQFIQQQQFGQQQQQFAQQQETNNEVEQFITANEFAGDLRGVMAEFMHMANNQGQNLSLPDAYSRAIATRPDIQQIIANRSSGVQNQQALGKAQQAAQSVPQASGIGSKPPAPQSTREAIEQAWNEG